MIDDDNDEIFLMRLDFNDKALSL